jgi:hypothetical protein
MRQEVHRESSLPAFELNIGDLELLLERLRALFDSPVDVRSSIDIDLKSEQLSFSSVDEIRAFNELPKRCTKFRISLSQGSKRLSISSNAFFRSNGRVFASAEHEAWCAGVVDTVNSFILPRRTWYWWIIAAPLNMLFYVYFGVSLTLLASLPKGKQIELRMIFAWAGMFIFLGILALGKERLLPASAIQKSEEEGFVRNHIAELSLAVAALSALISLIGLFLPK